MSIKWNYTYFQYRLYIQWKEFSMYKLITQEESKSLNPNDFIQDIKNEFLSKKPEYITQAYNDLRIVYSGTIYKYAAIPLEVYER